MRDISAAIFLLLLLTTSGACAQAKNEVPLWRQYSNHRLSAHRAQSLDKDPVTFRLLRSPVWIHNQSVKSESHALVGLWVTDSDRPVAVMSCILYKIYGRLWKEIDEFHSFHDDSIIVSDGQREVWRPQGPGVDWRELPDAPEPSETAKHQFLQARNLSRRFGVSGRYDGKDWELRLANTPVHKYATEDKEGRVTTGVLHVFCRQNDPEAMMLLEVRKNGNGIRRWHYALASFTNVGTHFQLDGEEVWSDDPARFGNAHVGFSQTGLINLEERVEALQGSQSPQPSE